MRYLYKRNAMNSDKAIFYYFSLAGAAIMYAMILLIALTCVVTSSPLDEKGWELVKKMLAFGVCFSVPPILYKLFAKEEPKEKKASNAGWLVACGIIWFAVIGLASGFLMAGMAKTAMWIYFASLIPAAMFLLPIACFFNTKGLFNDNTD